MNYYAHHIGDYEQATAHLTACEDGIYGRLIRWYMSSEQPLTADMKVIQRRVRAHSREERAAVQTVLAEFFRLADDGYHQTRCDEEIARYQDKRQKAQAAAIVGAQGRQRTLSERSADAQRTLSERSADAQRTLSERSADGTLRAPGRAPVPNNQEPRTTLAPEVQSTERAKRATRKCPSEFVASADLIAWARTKAAGVNVEDETAKFRDHTFGRAIADWSGAWRNWMRRAAEQQRRPKGVNGHNAEPAWVAEKRARMAQLAGPAAARATPITSQPVEVIDVPFRLD